MITHKIKSELFEIRFRVKLEFAALTEQKKTFFSKSVVTGKV